MKSCFLYALCEPGTRTVRYIGRTCKPRVRLSQHVRVSSKTKTHLGNWVRRVLSAGGLPEMILLREVPESESALAEIKYIRIARESLGMDLVNSTDGGDGVTMTEEIRRKLSDRSRNVSSEALVKRGRAISAAKKGVLASPEHRAKLGGRYGPLNSNFGIRRVGGSSRFIGVSLRKDSGRFRAVICYLGKRINLGTFASETKAAEIYDSEARKLYGTRAVLNFPE